MERRIVRGGFLLNRDGRRQPFDAIDIGLVQLLEQLARVGGEGFEIAPLPFGVERIEGQRRFAGAGNPGDDHQLVARNLQVDVFEIMNARALDDDLPAIAKSY